MFIIAWCWTSRISILVLSRLSTNDWRLSDLSKTCFLQHQQLHLMHYTTAVSSRILLHGCEAEARDQQLYIAHLQWPHCHQRMRSAWCLSSERGIWDAGSCYCSFGMSKGSWMCLFGKVSERGRLKPWVRVADDYGRYYKIFETCILLSDCSHYSV